jgi:hypothetical protein
VQGGPQGPCSSAKFCCEKKRRRSNVCERERSSSPISQHQYDRTIREHWGGKHLRNTVEVLAVEFLDYIITLLGWVGSQLKSLERQKKRKKRKGNAE